MAERKPVAPALDPEKVIPLDQPLKVGDVEYSQVLLREPTAGEMDDISAKEGVGWTIALVAAVSGIPLQVARRLPIRVLNECAEYLVPFTNSVRPTGQPS